MGNVISVLSTTPLVQEQRWRCKVCGREMAYSQPISLELSALLVGTFSNYHSEHCAPLVQPLPGTLGSAQLIVGKELASE